MLTYSWIETSTPRQIPLFPGSSRISEILTSPNNEHDRVHRLLNDWVDQYGKLLIQVDETAIIVGEHRIALEDITPKNASQNGIETFSDVSFSSQGNLLTIKPESIDMVSPEACPIDMVSPEAWMELIDNVPGTWAERRDNFLELLGNKCFSHKDDAYKIVYGEGYDVYFAYHTSESLWEDDGKFYWQLFIRSLPIPLNGRHGSGFMDEYAVKYPMDQELRDWGDEYIHFDVLDNTGGIFGFPAPPAAMRLVSKPIKN